jgi:hypothetical protein
VQNLAGKITQDSERNIRITVLGRHGDLETWKHGDMETWRHGEMEKWNMDTRRHGHGDMKLK